MSWFDEQIKQRKQNDDEVFEDAFVDIAGSVLGKKASNKFKDAHQLAKDAIEEILKYYHIKISTIPGDIKDLNDQLEFLLRPHGIMRREVLLEKSWYKDSMGAMLAFRKDNGSAVALIPSGFSGYTYYDFESGRKIKITKNNEDLFDDYAIAFYVPFPLKKMSVKDLFIYIFTNISLGDLISFAIFSLFLILANMLIAYLHKTLFGSVLDSKCIESLYGISVSLISTGISVMLISSAKNISISKIKLKLNNTIEAATMMRVLSLPAVFFQKYSSGDLANKVVLMNSFCDILVDNVFLLAVTSLFSCIYIFQIASFAPNLVLPSVFFVILYVISSIIISFVQITVSKKLMELKGKENGIGFALISGIQKIKLSGAEKRAFAKWGAVYSKIAELEYNPPILMKIDKVILLTITLLANLVMFYKAFESNISTANFYAFTTAYGMLSGAFLQLTMGAGYIAQLQSIIEMIKPILETEPELANEKEMVTKISGAVEISNLSFRYDDNMPLIFDNLSLKIKAGQYVAIVGKTGCGKSTLVRLLLGFEKAVKGAIYYDRKEISKIDLKSLRQKIGVVVQNGKLFQGTIFSNISISAPGLTMDEAWEAAKISGLDDDISNMPMGMHTVISEGGAGISGGQKQRLMIARAVAPKPKLLIFDEATSALDNITQKKVADSLNELKCTRIIIAHRLSTIKNCDRIIVLDKGKIVEDGKYDELMANNGFFKELVSRQQLKEGSI